MGREIAICRSCFPCPANRRFDTADGDVGAALNDATEKHAARDVVVRRTDIRRKSIAGVSIDAELTRVIAQQSAFAAAARLVNVAEEMMQRVLGMVS